MLQANVAFEDGVYGRRAVVKCPWSRGMVDHFRSNGVVELELNQGKGWRGTDISFLLELPNLVAFDIFDFSIGDISPIHSLHNLRQIGITTYCSTAIDFSAFPRLESCGLEWRRGAESLFDCATIIRLFVNRYKGKTVEPFSRLVKLEYLAILNAPVEDLSGLRSLVHLRALRLAGLRRLSSLRGIERLASLEELEIHTCRRIPSIEEVGNLPRLRQLYLNNDGDIESLKPLDRLSEVESVLFYESTNILDGDLCPLFRQKKLRQVSFQNRKHYSHRREDFGAAYYTPTRLPSPSGLRPG
jgi:hypothetical protein